METIGFVISYVTPYLAVIVLLGGVAFQLYRWGKKSPVPAYRGRLS